ncbi:MAG: polyhydroxyalkanoate synthesis regulator phasin [Parvicellaceae bacterium]|jgi:polyhydroxyalkanoate synthesis regulator phasin
MDNMVKTLAYAGLGLAAEANDKMKEQFDRLVELGKEKDADGKNLIGDFFKTVDSTKEDFEVQVDKVKAKAKDVLPFVKDKAKDVAEATATAAKEVKDKVEEAVEVN